MYTWTEFATSLESIAPDLASRLYGHGVRIMLDGYSKAEINYQRKREINIRKSRRFVRQYSLLADHGRIKTGSRINYRRVGHYSG